MPTPSENLALAIVQRLQSAGHTAYFAGGCVRDRLMNLTPKDFDVATSATPDQVRSLFPRSQEVGAAFGVILVREKIPKTPATNPATPEFAQVEVATFRADSTYSDGRHPDAIRFTTPEEDAQRRDFTCNGIFLDPLANGGGGPGGGGQLHDFVQGTQDIAAKTLRAIGTPSARFAEDHLRLLRAIRFAARLNFTIEPATFVALQSLAPNIKTISKERIHDELARILTHPTRAAAAALLQESTLLRHLWPPELFEHPENSRTFDNLAALPPDADFVCALIALHRDILLLPVKDPAPLLPETSRADSKTIRQLHVRDLLHTAQLLRRDLLLTNTETTDLDWLLNNGIVITAWQSLPKAPLKRLLADPRWPRLATLFTHNMLAPTLAPAFHQKIATLLAEGVNPTPYITGTTLIQLGATPGPNFKPWLDTLYDQQLNNEFPTKESALAAARTLLQSFRQP